MKNKKDSKKEVENECVQISPKALVNGCHNMVEEPKDDVSSKYLEMLSGSDEALDNLNPYLDDEGQKGKPSNEYNIENIKIPVYMSQHAYFSKWTLSDLAERILSIDLATMTPLEAFSILNDFQKDLRKEMRINRLDEMKNNY